MGYNFYQLFSYFMIYSVIGWLMETCIVSIQQKRFVNRGFLNGCYCPIYGIGMCGVILLFSPYKDNILILYIGGVIFTSALEFFTSWVMEVMFKARWWDYSQFPFNLNGRICLWVSMSWGILLVVVVKFLHPLIERLVAFMPEKQGTILVYSLALLLSVDFVYSMYGAFKFSVKLKSLSDIRKELAMLFEQSNIHIDDMRAKIMHEGFFKLNNKLASSVKSMLSVTGVAGIAKTFESLTEKYRERTGIFGKNEKRFLKAFPNLAVKKAGSIVTDIRETILKKKK